MGSHLVTLCPTDSFEEESFDTLYEVDEANYIGTGKFSVVHLCWRRASPERRFALKVINTRVGDMASLNRIQEEINILQLLGNHPGIIQLIDVDEQPTDIRIVMDLCEGGELYDRISQKQFYPEHEAKAAVKNLLEAVTFVHSKGIMHRDLKPENILLQSKVSNTDVKISDFGLAKMSRDYPRRLPRSHSICGSDFYLAPEVIKQEEYGREIDIWAVGVITYVLLSGSLPFFHNVLHKLYRQIVERDMAFPEQAWKNVSKGALDFILRLLQVRAGDRLSAEQSLSHPWLRGMPSGQSFGTSFTDQHLQRSNSNANYYSNSSLQIDSMRIPSHAHPNPLAHAHKVGEGGGSTQAVPTSGPQQRSVTPAGPPGGRQTSTNSVGAVPNYGGYPQQQPQMVVGGGTPQMRYR